MPELTDLEREVVVVALEMYGQRMNTASSAALDPLTALSTAKSARLARRREIARDLIGRI